VSRPQSFGAYDLLERVNVGGMAEVFRAIHRQSRRMVAIKRILPSVAEDDEFISMFRDEATIASQLDHPNIAKIFDIGRVDTSYYIALEYIGGRDMRTIVDNAERRNVQLPLDFTLHVMLSLCKGLDYAHRRNDSKGNPLGLVHRDVSPQNVLVSFDGDVKLIDFGIAKAAGKLARTQVGSIKGKFGYMSPEQVRGLPVDRRSDIFSVGICLWEFLTQRRLFHGENEIVVMERIRNAEVEPPTNIVPSLPHELEQMVMRALAKDADERYNSASDFHADLSAFAHTAGMVVQRDLVADYMRRTFPNGASHRAASREEAHAMADNKGGSDLDVFEGLARKPQARPATPPPTSPGPPSGASPSGAPPPPPGRARTLLGMAPPMPPSGRPPLPSTPGRMPMPSTPGLPPPPTSRGSGVLPAVMPPPAKSSAPPPGRGPLPSNPLPPPAAPPAKAGTMPGPVPAKPATVDMDWDDEDEKTQVYDKQSTEEVAQAIMQPLPAAGTPAPPPASAAAALLHGSGKVAAPMPKVPSMPPPAPAPVPGAHPSHASVAAAEPTMLSAPKEKKGSALPWILVALFGVLILGGLGFFFLMPSAGSLKVYVSGPGGRDIGKVDIFVDNEKVCTSSPCAVKDLKPGIHDVKAEAEGYEATAPKGVEIKGGSQAKLDLELAVASAGTGFKVAGAQQGVKLIVDGAEVGPLPQTIKNLSPGEHKLRFVGSDRYEALEKTVTVVPDKIEDLGDIKLKVIKGKATLQLVTRGARILLVPSKGEKRQIDERMFKNEQLSIDIDTSKEWRIEATKVGYEELKLPISFSDGDAEKTFRIELEEKGKAASDDKGTPTPTSGPTGPGPKPTTTATAAPSGGPAKLNINSIPPSAVLLDGRPLGRTPKAGVVVSPGTHTITFIHPEKGRKSTSVTVKAGQTKGVGVRF
jgi:eukaryotic-like serine/threonine-protein kinase